MTKNAPTPEPTMDLRDLLAPAVVRNGALASTLLFGAGVVRGQEISSDSLTSDAAVEHRADLLESQTYSIKTGDFRLLLTPELGFFYNSDIVLTDTNPQSDFIVRPSTQITATYLVGKGNLLKVDANVGYNQYLDHTEFSTLTVNSGSFISFDLYLGDYWLNLHDRFSYTRDPSEEAAVANTAVFGGLANTVGFSVTRDFQNLVPTLGYDHYNFIANSSTYSYLDNGAELLNARAGFRFHPSVVAGVEAKGSFTTYNEPLLNNSTGVSGGVYADWQAGYFLRISATGGYTSYFFDQTSQALQAMDQNAWYLGITMKHDLSAAVTYSVSAGHELRLGISTDTIDDWYLRAKADWTILKHLNLATSLSYENGTQESTSILGTLNREDYNWFGGLVTLWQPITKRLQVSLDYRFTIRSSNIQDRSYTQNLVGLRLTYLLQ